jgi:predicted nuclease with TOPRIM domain
MDSFDLEPTFSTSNIPGKCIKCLAEQELNNCLSELLRGDENAEELQKKFEMLVDFLKSPESQRIRDISEQYLAEGKKVTLRLSFNGEKPEYELEVS